MLALTSYWIGDSFMAKLKSITKYFKLLLEFLHEQFSTSIADTRNFCTANLLALVGTARQEDELIR